MAIPSGAAVLFVGAGLTVASRIAGQMGEAALNAANSDNNLAAAGISLIVAVGTIASGVFALAGGVTCSVVGAGLLTYGIIKATGYEQYAKISILSAAALAGMCSLYVGMPSGFTVLQ